MVESEWCAATRTNFIDLENPVKHFLCAAPKYFKSNFDVASALYGDTASNAEKSGLAL
jgi:hypothetical protein